jgi:hypothetical protein
VPDMNNAPTNKADFYRRWQALEFGNRVRMWAGQADLAASGYAGTVSARSKVPGGKCVYGVPADLAASSPQFAAMTFNETAPDDLLLVQGEFMHDGLRGYGLYCSADRLPMRKALAASGVQHWGLAALGRVKHYADAKGYDMLMELLDLYPEAVIEFGCYARTLGELPCNTVVWEVRNY